MGHVRVTRPAQRMLAFALAGAAIAAAGARALGQSSQDAPPPAPGATPEAAPQVALDEVLTPVIASQGGPTWEPLPALARDARASLARGVAGPGAGTRPEVDATLHGDPAMGCFVLALRLASGSAALHDVLREALSASRPGQDAPAWTLSDWTTASIPGPTPAGAAADTPAPPAGTRSTFAFTSEALQGEVRVLSRGVTPPADTMAVACFYNAREPARSARLCQRMLPALEAALSTLPAPRSTLPETSP